MRVKVFIVNAGRVLETGANARGGTLLKMSPFSSIVGIGLSKRAFWPASLKIGAPTGNVLLLRTLRTLLFLGGGVGNIGRLDCLTDVVLASCCNRNTLYGKPEGTMSWQVEFSLSGQFRMSD